MNGHERKVAHATALAAKRGRFGARMPSTRPGPWSNVVSDAIDHTIWGVDLFWQSTRRWMAIQALGLAQRLLPWFDTWNAKAIEELKGRLVAEDRVWDLLYHRQTELLSKRLDP